MKSPRELQVLANLLGGVPILGVLPDSPAERAGLCYGDIVTRVNGRETATFDEFLAAHDDGSESLELDVFRNGNYITVEMRLRKSTRESGPPPVLRYKRRNSCELS